MIYQELTGEINGCAMEVHRTLGRAFQEYIALWRVDFLVNDLITVEIKARTEIDDVHLAQAINYLEASSYPIDLLINFVAQSFAVQKIVQQKISSKSNSIL